MSPTVPKVTIGLPVRNGESFLERAIDCVLSQTFEDLELVISDNGSTDRTEEICASYAGQYPRIRYFRNDPDIGVLRNFNWLVELARGEYFRWLGVDDWLEPDYVAECVAALDANPHCIAVSTEQDHFEDTGKRRFLEYRGPRVDSDQPHERFARMLWFLTAGIYPFDPLFSMFRRQTLAESRLHQLMPLADRVLAAELSLVGPYCHVPKCLAHRRFPFESVAEVVRRVRPPGQADFRNSTWRRVGAMLANVYESNLTRYQKLYCTAASMRYYGKTVMQLTRIWAYNRLASMARRVGLTRSRLNGLLATRPRRD